MLLDKVDKFWSLNSKRGAHLPFHVHALVTQPLLHEDSATTSYSRTTAAQLLSVHVSWAGISQPQCKTGATPFDAVGLDTNASILTLVLPVSWLSLGLRGRSQMQGLGARAAYEALWAASLACLSRVWFHTSPSPLCQEKEKEKNNYSLDFNRIYVRSSNRDCPYTETNRSSEKR